MNMTCALVNMFKSSCCKKSHIHSLDDKECFSALQYFNFHFLPIVSSTERGMLSSL